jgi:hypothetical protein
MSELAAWRKYLDEIICQLDHQEKMALYEAVGVNRISLQRWRTGENTPDARHVQKLIAAVPTPRKERLRQLMLDDPKVRRRLASETAGGEVSLPRASIPPGVYERVLRAARNPPDRFWHLGELILGEALRQLGTKEQGLEITVARCMPPRGERKGGQKVRSLREHVGMGIGSFRADLHLKHHFMGVESIAGYVVMQRHGIMIPHLLATVVHTPTHGGQQVQSAAAYPIMYQKSIAGALIVSAEEANFFPPERLTLIEDYADLIRLAFYDEDFFSSSLIDLAVLPPFEVQETHFASFHPRVNAEEKRGELSLAELAQMESRGWERLEGELLRLSGFADEVSEQSISS